MTVKDLVVGLLNFDLDATVVLDLRKAPGLCARSHIQKVQDDAENTGIVTLVESSRYLTEEEVVKSARSLESDLREDR